MKKIFYLVVLFISMVWISFAFARDGEYQAFVSTDSGNYKATVEVENNEVVIIYPKDGGQMRLDGAKIVDGEADGTDSDGKKVHIEIDNYNSYSEVTESSGISLDAIPDEGVGTVPDGGSRSVP